MKAVDLFAGAGGWDLAVESLGFSVVGIENDRHTCDTRYAAGLTTVKGDVRNYGRRDFPDSQLLIASPPCQPFSHAGKGEGRAKKGLIFASLARMASRERGLEYRSDERVLLVTEPFRWVLEAIDDGTPFRVLAFEQVAPVLPIWQAMAEYLIREGYSVATGVLSAEQYGVPQTRRRAFLLASLDTDVILPLPTHRKFRKGVAQAEGDSNLKPWRSMGDVLSVKDSTYSRRWHFQCTIMKNATKRSVEEPAPTVAFGHTWGNAGWYLSDGSLVKKLSLEEASVLQTFPSTYPWQGPRSSAFQQIGNAVPPMWAMSVLSEVGTGLEDLARAA